jgi:hypothetical protein
MNNYAALIFLFFFTFILIKDLQTEKTNRVALIFNFIFTLFFFQMNLTSISNNYSSLINGDLKVILSIFKYSEDKLYYFASLFSFIDFAFDIYLNYILILLVLRKRKSRLKLIKILPIIWTIVSINSTLYYINKVDTPNYILFIPFVSLLCGLIVFGVYLLYSKSFMKRIFIQ